MSLVLPSGELPPVAFQLGPEIEDTRPRMFADDSLFAFMDAMTVRGMGDEGVRAANRGLIIAEDGFTLSHQQRVAMLAGALAALKGLGFTQQKHAVYAGLTHDCGKCAYQDIVHGSNVDLPPAEREQIQHHPILSSMLIRRYIKDEVVEGGALGHHLFRHGSAYPTDDAGVMSRSQKNLLKEQAIIGPDGAAQIVALADSFDAITSRRPYKAAQTIVSAYVELRREFSGFQGNVDILFTGMYGLPLSGLEAFAQNQP